MLIAALCIAVLVAALGWISVYELNGQVNHYRDLWHKEMESSRRMLKRHMRGELSVPDADEDDEPEGLALPDEYPELDGVEDRYEEAL
jgi:hypothetical protein